MIILMSSANLNNMSINHIFSIKDKKMFTEVIAVSIVVTESPFYISVNSSQAQIQKTYKQEQKTNLLDKSGKVSCYL